MRPANRDESITVWLLQAQSYTIMLHFLRLGEKAGLLMASVRGRESQQAHIGSAVYAHVIEKVSGGTLHMLPMDSNMHKAASPAS